ncbi:MAG: zinc finger domain-containing protein, partial [Isosphaeraceae bacterium]
RAERSSRAKCERCWNYRPDVGKNAEHPTLCGRCVRVIGEATSPNGDIPARGVE